MKLVSVYGVPTAVDTLYQLLLEREPHQSISHKHMPTHGQHARFFQSKPYLAWYLMETADGFVGAIYLTKQREVGIFVFKDKQGSGYGQQALSKLRIKWPGRILANVAPSNTKSREFFTKQGGKIIQLTFELK